MRTCALDKSSLSIRRINSFMLGTVGLNAIGMNGLMLMKDVLITLYTCTLKALSEYSILFPHS